MEALAPDAPVVDEQSRRDRRRLSVSATFDGMVDVHGLLDPEGGAALLAAMEGLTRPLPEDSRSPAQRRADALAEIARLALTVGELPDTQRGRPHVAVLIEVDRLTDPASAGHPSPRAAEPGAPLVTRGPASAQDLHDLDDVFGPDRPPIPGSEPREGSDTHQDDEQRGEDGEQRGEDGEQRGEDGEQRGEDGDGPGGRYGFRGEPAAPPAAPGSTGSRNPDPGRALRGRGDPLHALGVPLPGEISRDRLGPVSWSSILTDLCDASIRRVVLDPDGDVLDVGRTTRTWPAAIATAIILRDRCCTWPGCDRPPAHCDIDHIIPWWEGGATSISNGRLRCRYHHTLTHHGWTEHTHPDGTRTMHPPPEPNPHHHRHRRRSPY